MAIEDVEHVGGDRFGVSAETDIHLVPLDVSLLITLVKYFLTIYDFELILHLLFIRAIVKICGICTALSLVYKMVFDARRRSLVSSLLASPTEGGR